MQMQTIPQEKVEKYHKALPVRICTYLNQRAIPDDIINKHKIGWNGSAITIPIYNKEGEASFFKYRKDPKDQSDKAKYWCDTGVSPELYGWENVKSGRSPIVICEGELDRLVLEANGIPAITSTNGAKSFKEEWIPSLSDIPEVYICFDNDDTGMDTSQKIAKALPRIKIIVIPKENNMKDITDFFIFNGIEDFKKLMEEAKSLEDIEKENHALVRAIKKTIFKPFSSKELLEILGLTVKHDEINKLITFLCLLSAYTESSQFNISFNAPSSTGKSYMPLELVSLFPKEDAIKVAYCSPTAFFHDRCEFNKERKEYLMNLERKMIVFLDAPHNQLLQHLRPLLSHDEKEIQIKITDKSQKFGLKTKNIIIKGFSSVIFCSAGLKVDEQEATRFLLLSPETTQEKIREGIIQVLTKETDVEAYFAKLNSNPQRQCLIERIKAIKEESIKEIKLHDTLKIEKWFFDKHKPLKPRHQRDIKRLIYIIKSFALLNLWDRLSEAPGVILTSDEDVEQGFKIWDEISVSQELNLPPYIYRFFTEIIMPLFESNGDQVGLSRKNIMQGHLKIYGRPIEEWKLRREIVPMLEMSGLIIQEQDPNDKRNMLVIPVYPTVPSQLICEEINGDSTRG